MDAFEYDIEPFALFVFGKCGSGKSTCSKYLSQMTDSNLFSGGALIRKLVASNRLNLQKKKKINKILESGLPLDKSSIDIVLEHVEWDKSKSVIFDGFPRSVEQTTRIPEIINKISLNYPSKIIGLNLIVPDTIVKKRIQQRKSSKQSKRADDESLNSIEKRLTAYNEYTLPALRLFQENFECVDITYPNDSEEYITSRIFSKLSRY